MIGPKQQKLTRALILDSALVSLNAPKNLSWLAFLGMPGLRLTPVWFVKVDISALYIKILKIWKYWEKYFAKNLCFLTLFWAFRLSKT